MTNQFKPSPYQQRFLDWLRAGQGSAVVKAVAGSGKTTTVIQGLAQLPETAHVAVLMFNAAIAQDANKRIAKLREDTGRALARTQAKTFHSLGYGPLRKWLGNRGVTTTPGHSELTPDPSKMRALMQTNYGDEENELYADYCTKLVGYARGAGLGVLVPDLDDHWYALTQHHDMFLEDEAATEEQAIAIARNLLRLGNVAAERGVIDFDDMLYQPLRLKLRLWQNDYVFIDECFVPDTPILIGLNGEQRTIKELVEENYRGPIVTWSKQRGTHISRVTGVKRVPIGKPLIRLRTKQRGYSKDGVRLGPLTEEVRYGIRTVVCTIDHKIWTTRGWIKAGELKPGMVVKHETAAPIMRSYQSHYAHTAKGRKVLSDSADHKRFGGYAPTEFRNRGGNGQGPTKHETLLLERLGSGWTCNGIIATGSGRPPHHYKVDLINQELGTIIEVDGRSHESADRKRQDRKKDTWLKAHGWKVIRLTNKEVLTLTNDLLLNRIVHCPVDAEVVSVEVWENNKHAYVYDLSVEDTHCYFAHGLLVHNCQDTNPVRRALAKVALRPGGRLVAVGDPRQAIYGFTGASHDAMDLIARDFNTIELPLTVCYRCATSIVRHAQTLVPYLEAHGAAPEGKVETLHPADAQPLLTSHDAVLCRNVAPLMAYAFECIAKGVPVTVLGRDIGQGLLKLVRKQKASGIDRLVNKLEAWRDKEVAKFMAKGQEQKAESVSDRVACVLVIIDNLPQTDRTVPALVRHLETLFSDDNGKLMLSTVHKAKGREWPTVAILRPDLMPSRWARQEWQALQESNLQYVAWTRAQRHLIFLDPAATRLPAAQPKQEEQVA